jgi:hypothetical protein
LEDIVLKVQELQLLAIQDISIVFQEWELQMIVSLVHLGIIVLGLQIRSQLECAQQGITVLVEVQPPLSMLLFRVTMLSRDQLCKLNANLVHIVTQVMQLHANLAIQANIALILEWVQDFLAQQDIIVLWAPLMKLLVWLVLTILM